MLTLFENVEKSAVFSADRVFRYELSRTWGVGGRYLNFLMLNPSKANEFENDPTVERCERRARMWGYDGLLVTNLFAFRATDPNVMLIAPEPVGLENDEAIRRCADRSEMVICAWGKDGGHRGRAAQVVKLLSGFDLHALKVSETTGQPWHPLYIAMSVTPKLWREAA